MSSTRLPGKSLMPIAGKPMLQRVIERAQRAKTDEVVVLTSWLTDNYPIVSLCDALQVPVFRGAEGNVLERFYYCSLQYPCDYVVRITGDCPCIDPRIIEECIEKSQNYDYFGTTDKLDGLDVEVVKTEVLRDAWSKAKSLYDKEHVTPYIKRTGKVGYLDKELPLKLSVDTIENLLTVRQVYSTLGENFGYEELKEWMSSLDH